MALSIQSQVLRAAQAARFLAGHAAVLGKASERASTGYRVNRASDDAAGLSIAESLQAQVRGTLAASRNVLDGISMLNIADAAVSEIADGLHRMRELAVQSANGVYSDAQRQNMEQEFAQLKDEIDYVTRQANYNGYFLLRGGSVPAWTTLSRTTTDVSSGSTDGPFTITPQLSTFTPGMRTLDGLGQTQVALGASVPENYGLGTGGPQSIVVEAVDTGTGVVRTIPVDPTNGFTYAAGGNTITFHGTGTPTATENVRVRYIPAGSTTRTLSGTPVAGSEAVTVNGAPAPNAGSPLGNGYYLSGNTASLVGTARPDAAGGPVTWSASYMTQYVNSVALDTESPDYAGGVLNMAALTVTVDGVPVAADPLNGYSVVTTQTDEVGGTPLYSYQVQLNGTSQVSGAGPHTISVSYDFDQPASVDPLQVIIQEGANQGETNGLSIARLTVGGLGLAASHVKTQAAAENTLTALNQAIDRMNVMRAGIGAYESSLDHAYTNVLNANLNQDAARSAIRDVDMADAATQIARASILRDGAMATITQITSNAGYLVQLLR